MKTEREFTQDACRELCESFADKGFTTSKNGLKTTRKIDKDITQQFLCQITRQNDIIIHFYVESKKIKRWLKDTYQIESFGEGLGTQLGYITKQDTWKSWYIGKSEIARQNFLKEARDMITNYLIPYFDRFYNSLTFIEYICSQGSISKECVPPISFILQYGTIKQVGILLDNYFKNNPKIFITTQKNKPYFEDENFSTMPFCGAREIKLAILNNVILTNPLW